MSSGALAIAAVLCASAITRSVLWTVSYPLAAEGAEQRGVGLGVVMGLLQAVWAVTAVLSPLAAGSVAGTLSPHEVMAVALVTCLVVLAMAVAWVSRRQVESFLRTLVARVGVTF